MAKTIKIFISSPGDVVEERRRAAIVISRLKREFARFFDVSAGLWEYEPMLASGHFQDIIEPPSRADIVVVILWSRLGTALPPQRYRGIDDRAPVTGTEWEYEDALRANRASGTPDLLVYRKQAEAVARFNRQEQLDDARRQWEAVETFWRRHFSDDGSFKAAFNSFANLDEFEAALEQHLRQLLKTRLPQRLATGAAATELTWHQGSPFRGLEAFELEHAAVFFGREQATRDVIEQLATNAASGCAFLMVLGASGSGKSSLVKAGAIPDLMAPGVIGEVALWRRCNFRPGGGGGGDLFDRLARALIDQPDALPELPAAGIDAAALAGQFRAAPAQAALPLGVGLARAREGARHAGPGTPRLILAVDQFEELFGAGEAPAFVALLAALARSGQVWVIATLRSDFYHRCADLAGLSELVAGAGNYQLLPPRSGEIEQMVRLPAAAAGLRFEIDPTSGLGLDAVLTEAASRDAAALPLLSFALDELYRRDVVDAKRDLLTFESYETLGRLEGAIANRAEAVCAALPDNAAAEIASLLTGLIVIDEERGLATARLAPRAEVARRPGAVAALDALIAARLVVTSGDATSAVVRLAHEALIGRWPRLAQLIEQNRAFLQARTRLQADRRRWEREERNPDLLLPSGKRLAEAQELLADRRDELDADTATFIERSLARDKADRDRRLRRTRNVAIGATALSIIAVVGGIYAWVERGRAESALAQADRNYAAALGAGSGVVDIVRDLLTAGTISTQMAQSLLDVPRKTVVELQNEKESTEVLAVEWRLFNALTLAYGAVPGQGVKALELANRLRVLAERMAADQPANTAYAQNLAISLIRLSDVQYDQGNFAGAADELRTGQAVMTKLLAKDRANLEWRTTLGVVDQRLGDAILRLGDLTGALREFQNYLDIFTELAGQKPPVPYSIWSLGLSHERMGDILREMGNLPGALDHFRKFETTIEGLLQTSEAPDSPNFSWRIGLSIAHQRVGDVLLEQADYAKALAEYEAFERGAREPAHRDPQQGDWQRFLGNSHEKIGDAQFALHRFDQALKEYKLALEIYERLVAKDELRASWRRTLAIIHERLGVTHQAMNNRTLALDAFNACLAIPVDDSSIDWQVLTPRLVHKDCQEHVEQLGRTAR